MKTVDWTALAGALLHVEHLTANDTGMLAFDDARSGGIFVEKGRICWVAARGLSQRLRDLLLVHSSIAEADLDRVCERCRADGRPMGQTLVNEGWIQPQELERALRHHSAECLIELCRAPHPTSWSSHAGKGYAPRFTFRPVELLLDSVGALFPERQAEARAELDALESLDCHAAAFLFDVERDCLLPVAERGGQGLEALNALGRWASARPRASLELAAEPSFTLAVTEGGQAVMVWWRKGLLFAQMCEDRSSLAAATGRRLACA